MLTDFKREGLIVSSSDVPLIRAGYANILFLLLIIGLILLNQASSCLGINSYIRGIILIGFCLLMLKIYAHSVSRIYIKDGKALIMIGPFSTTEISTDRIFKTKVYGIPSSVTIILKVRRKESFLPEFYFFIAVSTNYGSYADTITKLLLLLAEPARNQP